MIKKIPTIIGPTAVGKTDFAIKLAMRISGEIISADSRQIYKFLDIGTAKPTLEQRQTIPFHLIDWVLPDVQYSCAQFARDAEIEIAAILKKNKNPIVCGGTGLYIKALFQPLHDLPESSTSVKKKYANLLEQEGLKNLFEKLKSVDPVWARKISSRDTQRILRALEVYDMTGIPMTQLIKKKARKAAYRPCYIGLMIPRKELYERINQRFDNMIEKGLVSEIESILQKGFDVSAVAFRTIGYQELLGYIQKKYSLEKAIIRAKQRTRNFARRQIIWFRKIPDIEWFNPDDDHVIDYLTENLGTD